MYVAYSTYLSQIKASHYQVTDDPTTYIHFNICYLAGLRSSIQAAAANILEEAALQVRIACICLGLAIPFMYVCVCRYVILHTGSLRFERVPGPGLADQ